jgi:3D-(3,5/4)-trihydroxycyclohexane-1,2-dione acylhydrolase (decyclizing)
MPGDLHKLWRVRDRKGYHVEYGYSCMGYEVPASIGIRLADPSRDVFAMVGDGGYLMMPTELVTAVQERVKVVVVLVQNHGFHSIGSLSESLGSQRFGTSYRYRGGSSGRLDGERLPVDLAANARSLGAHVIEVHSRAELEQAVKEAKAAPADGGPVVIHVETDPSVQAPDSDSWWDVPVSAVSELESTREAHAAYVERKLRQRPLVGPQDA